MSEALLIRYQLLKSMRWIITADPAPWLAGSAPEAGTCDWLAINESASRHVIDVDALAVSAE